MSDKDTSIFSGSDQNPPKDTQQQQKQEGKPADSGDNPLAILVGEGRKYKSIEELAKAYIKADGFIEQLKSENSELREKTVKSKTIDEVLDRLQQGNASTQDQGADKAQAPGLTAEAVAKIVRDTVTGLETARTRQTNRQKADADMRKLFGDKAGEVFAAQAATPEMKAALTQLAEVAPEQFVKLFKQGQAPQGGQADSGSSINSTALADINASGRGNDAQCKEFYDQLRKKEPGKYYSSEVQLAMNKAAQANPEKFFGRKLTA